MQCCGPTTRTVLAQVRGGATSSVGAGGLRADGERCCALGSVRGPSQGSAAPARVRHGEPRAGDATDVPVQAGHEHADAALGPLAVRKREERGPRSLAGWCRRPVRSADYIYLPRCPHLKPQGNEVRGRRTVSGVGHNRSLSVPVDESGAGGGDAPGLLDPNRLCRCQPGWQAPCLPV